MRHAFLLPCVATLAWLTGCATPPPVKQAVASLDTGYAENVKLVRQFRDLAQQNTLNFRQWTLYVQNRAYLDLALRWATTDPRVPTIADADYTDASNERLGPRVVTLVNQLRLKDLPARAGSNGAVFAAGTNDITHLVEGLPALVNAVRAQVLAANEPNFKMDASAFDDYVTNVNALRRINALIQRYLDIDVTVRPADIKEIADSVRALAK
jgi:hypothetical protein